MDKVAKAKVLSLWSELPSELRFPPATEEQLKAFEEEYGRIPVDFRWFLSACGGGVVGDKWVDGIDGLYSTQEKFVEESGADGWTLQDTFIIGWDGAGNPFGIQLLSGAVVTEDHTFGGVHEVAPSFEAFLLRGLSVE